MDLASDGRTLYQAVASSRAVVVNGQRTKDAPGPLMGERVAVSPVGSIAVVARIGSGPLQDRAYACRMGQPWYELGPTAQLQGIAWIGGQFVCARIGAGGGSLVEQTIEGSIIGTDVANTSQGILYYDDLDSRWVIQSQAVTTVGKYQMLKAIRRKLPDGRIVACGQVTNPDRIVIASFDGSIAFQAGEQIHTPVFVTMGAQLACLVKNNALKTFTLPYPKVDLPAPPPPPPPPEPPMPPTIPNPIPILKKWRAFYDHMPKGKKRGFLICNAAAIEIGHGVGLLAKPNRTDSTYEYKGKHHPADIIVLPDNEHYDALEDGDGKASPTWQHKGPIRSDWKRVGPYPELVSGIPVPPEPEPPGPEPPPPPNPPPPQPPAPPPRPEVPYDQFVKVEAQQVYDRYVAVHGRAPAPADLYHNAYRRTVERRTHEAILADIKVGG